jgi:long-chain acyl-CoA synthetase
VTAEPTVTPSAETSPVSGGAPRRPVGRSAAWLAKQVELALAGVDLSLPQYRVLGLLAEGSAMSSALAARLAVRPPSITAVVDGLVTRGLVTRRRTEDDRRRVPLAITAKGERLLAAADSATESRLGAIACCLSDAEAGARLLDDLELWRQAVAAYRAQKDQKDQKDQS